MASWCFTPVSQWVITSILKPSWAIHTTSSGAPWIQWFNILSVEKLRNAHLQIPMGWQINSPHGPSNRSAARPLPSTPRTPTPRRAAEAPQTVERKKRLPAGHLWPFCVGKNDGKYQLTLQIHGRNGKSTKVKGKTALFYCVFEWHSGCVILGVTPIAANNNNSNSNSNNNGCFRCTGGTPKWLRNIIIII